MRDYSTGNCRIAPGKVQFIVIMAGLCFGLQARAQVSGGYVLANGGGSAQMSNGYTLDFTVGEPVISTIGTTTYLTQGFQQPLQLSDFPAIFINVAQLTKASLTVFPNPVKAGELLSIALKGLSNLQLKGATLRIYNSKGSGIYNSSQVTNFNQLAFYQPQGLYIVKFLSPSGLVLTCKINVINK